MTTAEDLSKVTKAFLSKMNAGKYTFGAPGNCCVPNSRNLLTSFHDAEDQRGKKPAINDWFRSLPRPIYVFQHS